MKKILRGNSPDSYQQYQPNSSALIAQIIECSPIGIAVIDYDGMYVAINPVYADLYGYSIDEMLNKSFLMVFPKAQHQAMLTRHQFFLNEGGTLNGEWDVQGRDGRIFRVMSESVKVQDDPGHFRRLVYVVNITERRQMELALRESEQKLRILFESVSTGVMSHDVLGRVISANQAAQFILGLDISELQGKELSDFVFELHSYNDHRIDSVELPIAQLFRDGKTFNKQLLGFKLKSGRQIWLNFGITPIFLDGKLVEIYSTFEDVTQHIIRELDLRKQVTTDTLTGLSNRFNLMACLSAQYERIVRNPEQTCSVLMLDVDHFKKINDQWGHAAGDLVLVHIAQLMQQATRPYDTVARIGGEEFVVLLPDIERAEAYHLAERIRYLIETSEVKYQRQDIRYTVSIGISSIQASDHDIGMVLKRADSALYMVKNHGRNGIHAYDATDADSNQP